MIDIGKKWKEVYVLFWWPPFNFIFLKVVSFEKLMSGTRICEPFELHFSNQSNSVAVSLKVGQNKKLEVSLLFRLEDSREKVSPQDQGILVYTEGLVLVKVDNQFVRFLHFLC